MIPKPGKDETQATSYRPIAVLPRLYKLVETCIKQRIQPIFDDINRLQSGFRVNRQVEENVAYLRSLQDFCKVKKQPLFVCYIDIKAAYDTVERTRLMQVLASRGCPTLLINLLWSMLTNYQFSVRVRGVRSTPRPTARGLPQSGVLGPLLFNLLFDQLLRECAVAIGDDIEVGTAVPFDRRRGPERIQYLAYADDLCMFARSKSGLSRLVSTFEATALRFGLTISTDKSYWQCLNHPNGFSDISPLPSLTGTIPHTHPLLVFPDL